jgi:hypothetical protein
MFTTLLKPTTQKLNRIVLDRIATYKALVLERASLETARIALQPKVEDAFLRALAAEQTKAPAARTKALQDDYRALLAERDTAARRKDLEVEKAANDVRRVTLPFVNGFER